MNFLLPMVLILAAVAVYQSSLGGQFVFDSIEHIPLNTRIHQLWPPNYLMHSIRPVLHTSLALNYAIGGAHEQGYHVVNLVIHIMAALTLFGVVRRTLLLPKYGDRFSQKADYLAFAIALVWVVHPLNTQAVTFVIQRGESLMGLFYLLTLYCVIRCATASGGGGGGYRPLVWLIAAAVAFALGVGSKLIIVTSPMVVLLYDWTFLKGGFCRTLLRLKRVVIPVMVVTLLLIGRMTSWGKLFFGSHSIGFGVKTKTPADYLLSQGPVLLKYLQLSFWPSELVIDYGWPPVARWTDAAGPWVVIVLLIALTLYGLAKRSAFGFMGAWFFVILLPTSSFVPLFNRIAEHRMYLSLIGVVAVAVAVFYLLIEKFARSRMPIATVLLLAVVVSLGARTIDRNRDYHDPKEIWRQVIEYRPLNLRAYNEYGFMLLDEPDRIDQAVVYLRKASQTTSVQLLKVVQANLGKALIIQGNAKEALAHLKLAREADPQEARIPQYMGDAHVELGNIDEAVKHYREAIKLQPDNVGCQLSLGAALLNNDREKEAIEPLKKALELQSNNPLIRSAYGLALARSGDNDGAFQQYSMILTSAPNHAQTHCNLGEMYLGTGQLDESEKHLGHAIAVGGDFPDARKLMVELAAAYGTAGKPLRSIAVIETTIQALPNNPSVAAERDELRALLEHYRQSSCQAPRDTASSRRA